MTMLCNRYLSVNPTSKYSSSKQEKPMSKHDTPTKPHRRPKSAKRVDYTARTMAALKQLAHEAKLRESQSPLPKTLESEQAPLIFPLITHFWRMPRLMTR